MHATETLSNSNRKTRETCTTCEFPTIPLIRDAVESYCLATGATMRDVARDSGVRYQALADICSREPGYRKSQDLYTLIRMVDSLGAIGVPVSRRKVAEIILCA
jgi:hypothetical protein